MQITGLMNIPLFLFTFALVGLIYGLAAKKYTKKKYAAMLPIFLIAYVTFWAVVSLF